eukprot:93719-Hanusia_phi.AAC.8
MEPYPRPARGQAVKVPVQKSIHDAVVYPTEVPHGKETEKAPAGDPRAPASEEAVVVQLLQSCTGPFGYAKTERTSASKIATCDRLSPLVEHTRQEVRRGEQVVLQGDDVIEGQGHERKAQPKHVVRVEPVHAGVPPMEAQGGPGLSERMEVDANMHVVYRRQLAHNSVHHVSVHCHDQHG